MKKAKHKSCLTICFDTEQVYDTEQSQFHANILQLDIVTSEYLKYQVTSRCSDMRCLQKL